MLRKKVPVKMLHLVPLLRGLITHIPRFSNILSLNNKDISGTKSARYCYSIWLRHLTLAHKHNLETYPKVVAELGPGESLGTGLAALLSGAEKYYAFDIVKHADTKRNLIIFKELLDLFKKREGIPDEEEFPEIRPRLNSYDFPDEILTENRIEKALRKKRVEKIKESILKEDYINEDSNHISYFVPWNNTKIIERESVDMIFSQAVLEHVNNLKNTYKAMYYWLKPNGYVSHEIDFRMHGLLMNKKWDIHWTYSDFVWKLVKGNRRYFINREPFSRHLKLLKEEGFKINFTKREIIDSTIERQSLAPAFKNLNPSDLKTSTGFIQAIKTN